MLLPGNMQVVNEDTGWLLDYFSVKELERIFDKETKGLVARIKHSIIRAAIGSREKQERRNNHGKHGFKLSERK